MLVVRPSGMLTTVHGAGLPPRGRTQAEESSRRSSDEVIGAPTYRVVAGLPPTTSLRMSRTPFHCMCTVVPWVPGSMEA